MVLVLGIHDQLIADTGQTARGDDLHQSAYRTKDIIVVAVQRLDRKAKDG